MAAIQSVDIDRNPHVSAGPAPIRLQNRHALACGPLQPGEKPHVHAWRFCSHTMQPQKAYVRITVIDESLKAAVVPNVPHPAIAAARRKCHWSAVARCCIIRALSWALRGNQSESRML